MKRREPKLIGDLMRQMGIVRADNSVDKDLVCTLITLKLSNQNANEMDQTLWQCAR